MCRAPIGVTGGDAITSGNFTATYCTAPVANACTAKIDSGNYKTIYPYIETYLNTTIAGGANVTLPTVTAQFTASGSAGTVVPVDLTEFAARNHGDRGRFTVNADFDGYPSCSSCGSANPPTYAGAHAPGHHHHHTGAHRSPASARRRARRPAGPA